MVSESGVAPRRRTRLSPAQREQMILDEAIVLFAEHGFGAQTKELASRLGVSEALIYRYFSTKDVLVDRVFEATIQSRWEPEWEHRLRAGEAPISERLVAFYKSYLGAVDDPVWTRIVMYSSLAGLDLTRGYIHAHVERILQIISDELAEALGTGPLDREVLWDLHSTFIYYLVRKHIHLTPVTDKVDDFVTDVVTRFLDGISVR
jgi:AcrR family transcriptional regulator